MKKNRMFFLLLVLVLLSFSCKNSSVINIPVKTKPIIKGETGATLTIIPLFGKDYYVDAVSRASRDVIDIIEENTNFLVIDSDEVRETINEMDSDTLKAFSKSYAREVGEKMKSRYVLYGELKFDISQYDSLEYAPNIRYGADQEYAPYIDEGPRFSTYDIDIEMKYSLSIDLKLLNMTTDKLIMEEKFTDYSKYIVKKSDLPLQGDLLNDIFTNLLYNVIEDFRNKLYVHDIEEERYVFTK
jgi:hypothetical protein